MMLAVVLVFLGCLGNRCEVVRLPFDGNAMQCALFGQQVMAAWRNEHPGWQTFGRYRCTSEREA